MSDELKKLVTKWHQQASEYQRASDDAISIRDKFFIEGKALQAHDCAHELKAALQQQGEVFGWFIETLPPKPYQSMFTQAPEIAAMQGSVEKGEVKATPLYTHPQQGEAVAWIHKNGRAVLLDEAMIRATNPADWNPLYTHPPEPVEPTADRAAIKLLVAAGFITEEKANEALNIAHGFSSEPLTHPPKPVVSEPDWKDLYRLQTAMRYMDNTHTLPQSCAFKMADQDIAALVQLAKEPT